MSEKKLTESVCRSRLFIWLIRFRKHLNYLVKSQKFVRNQKLGEVRESPVAVKP